MPTLIDWIMLGILAIPCLFLGVAAALLALTLWRDWRDG